MERYFIVGWMGGHPSFYQNNNKFAWLFVSGLKSYKTQGRAIKAADRLSKRFICDKISVFKFAADNRIISSSVIYQGEYNDNLIYETKE
jgi:hypothetical protein